MSFPTPSPEPILPSASLSSRLASTGASTVAAFALGVANSILLTRLLGAHGRGEFAIFSAASALLIVVLFFGLDFALGYFIAQGRVRVETVAPSAFAYALTGGVLCFILVLLGDRLFQAELFLPRSKQQIAFELLLAMVVASGLAFAAGRALFLGTRSFHSLNVLEVAIALASVATYAVLYWLSGRWFPPVPSGGVLAVYTVLSLLSAAVLWFLAFRALGLRWAWKFVEPRAASEMLGVGLKAYLGNVLQFLNYRFDYWLVAYFTDLRTLGFYSLASTLGQMLWLLPRSAATVFLPVFASGERRNMESQALVGRLALWTTAGAAVVGAGLSGWLIPLLYGHEFRDVALPFRILLIGSVPYTLSIILASGLAARGLQAENTRASFWGFVATVAFGVALIPVFGMPGAATASTLSYLVTTAYVLRRFSSAFSIPVSRLLIVQRGDGAVLLTALREQMSFGRLTTSALK